MTAIAEVIQGVVKAIVDIDVPLAAVFDALTNPAELTAWWGSPDTYRTFDWEIDLRAGGKWTCKTQRVSGGPVQYVGGEYITVDPPRLLEYTWRPQWDNYAETRVRCELEPTATGTRLKVTHSGFADAAVAAGHADGWTRVIGWMVKYLKDRSA
jgi:uncharacterized protein YndB with AHSA1/START domain